MIKWKDVGQGKPVQETQTEYLNKTRGKDWGKNLPDLPKGAERKPFKETKKY